MASTTEEIAYYLPTVVRILKDGRVERLTGNDVVPPSIDPVTGVESKDVVINPETCVSARLYKTQTSDPTRKLPLLLYFHGGGFVLESVFSPVYHNYLNSLVVAAGVVAASVNYRRAPEHPLPTPYDDCWAAVKWIGSHASGSGPDAWLNDHANFDRVFFAGDSAGANAAHHMALRVGSEGIGRVKLVGIALIHPYFMGKDPIGSEPEQPELKEFMEKVWVLACPSSSGLDDPMINPLKDPNLSNLGCRRVLVCVAGEDVLRDRGRRYCKELDRGGRRGQVELVESQGEVHVFHLYNPGSGSAMALLKKVASFINQP